MSSPDQPVARRLVVVRHSKAEPYAPTDAERGLTERGRHDAAAAGAWLRESAVVPDLALVSAADRALQTWEEIAGAAGWTIQPQVEQSLYAADEDSVLELLALTDESVGTAVVVGHNPTMAALALLLDDGEGRSEETDRLAAGFPTTAVAVFDVPTPWADLGPGTARLRAFHVGRG